jgi:hypothetical protein
MSIASSRSLSSWSPAAAGVLVVVALAPRTAFAQAAAPAQSGQAPADVAQTVAAPKAVDAPTIEAATPTDTTDVSISAGGQYASGNAKEFAATGLGKVDLRRGANGFGAQLTGNYAEGATVPSASMKTTTENLQGKLRYLRYFTTAFGGFLQVTGTHDAFTATTFRLNIDPGVKLFFFDNATTRFWGELGYDFEFDQNYTDSNGIMQAGSGGPSLDANGLPYVIEKNNTIHSTRLFVGFKQAFNTEVTLNLGLEYLQGLGGTGTGTPNLPPGYTAGQVDVVPISVTGARLNGDALLAAHIGGGFSIGVGLSEKYNSAALAGKLALDSTGTLSLIYGFSSGHPAPPAPPPPECPKTPEPPPSPPAGSTPVAAAAPTTAAPNSAAPAPAAADSAAPAHP